MPRKYPPIEPGQVFDKLVVLRKAPSRNRSAYWLVRCTCGHEFERRTAQFRQLTNKGCQRCAATYHGLTGTSIHNRWNDMRQRCGNPLKPTYKYYGGRGIRVCARWQRFENFYEDMGEPPSPKHSLDRIDTNGNYEPANCRWATRHEQMRNTRTNVRLTYKGETKTLAEWAEIFGVTGYSIHLHLDAGRTFAEIASRYLAAPVHTRRAGRVVRTLTYNDKTQSIPLWAEQLQVSPSTLYRHLKRGRSFEWIVDHFTSRRASKEKKAPKRS